MKINPAKSSEWNSVQPEFIAREIKHLSQQIDSKLQKIDAIDLGKKNKTELKSIVAELVTIQKRLNWMLDGKY